MRKIAFVLLAATGFLAAGCNTVAGIGQDISAIGRGLTNSSDDVVHRSDNRQQQSYDYNQGYNQGYSQGQRNPAPR